MGMMPMVMPVFSNIWNASIDNTPTHTSAPKKSRESLAVRQVRHITMANRARSTTAPRKPSSSPTDVKMKSVCCSGTKPPWVCEPSPRPSPPNAAVRDRLLRLLLVVGVALRVRASRIDERREPVDLVLLEDPEVHDRVDAGDREQHEHEQLSTGEAGHREQPHDDDDEDEHGAEVGLEEDEPDGYGGEREDRGDAPRVELTAVLVAVAGQRHDHAELGQLRRLEREPTRQLEPCLVALDVRAERREHRDQQDHRRDVGDHRVVAQAAVVDREHADHGADADQEEQPLALDEIELVAGDAVPRGRPDHHEPDDAERDRGADEHEVEMPHRRGVEPMAHVASSPGADSGTGDGHQSFFFTGAGLVRTGIGSGLPFR